MLRKIAAIVAILLLSPPAAWGRNQCNKDEPTLRAAALASSQISDSDAYLQCYRYFDRAPEVVAHRRGLEERAAYDRALRQNAVQPLLEFVMTYPSSPLVGEARRKVADIEKGQHLHDYESSALAGTQLKRGSVADLAACRSACQKENNACAGFTYHDAQRACTLWGSVTSRTPDPAARSGARQPIAESAAPVRAEAPYPTVAAPTVPALPPVPTSGRFAYYPGYDLLRGDLGRVAPIGQGDCEDRCAVDSRCVAYVYQKTMGTCLLKDAIVARAPNPDSVTALKPNTNTPAPTAARAPEPTPDRTSERDLAIYQNTDFANPPNSPADYGRIDFVELPQCVTRCQNDRRCRAFTYHVGKKVCWLKSSYQEVRNYPGAVSGIRR